MGKRIRGRGRGSLSHHDHKILQHEEKAKGTNKGVQRIVRIQKEGKRSTREEGES